MAHRVNHRQAARVTEHRATVHACLTAARLISAYDLRGALDAIARADTVGPILDPTLYKAKAEAMHQDAEILRAALPLWKLALEMQAAIEANDA